MIHHHRCRHLLRSLIFLGHSEIGNIKRKNMPTLQEKSTIQTINMLFKKMFPLSAAHIILNDYPFVMEATMLLRIW